MIVTFPKIADEIFLLELESERFLNNLLVEVILVKF